MMTLPVPAASPSSSPSSSPVPLPSPSPVPSPSPSASPSSPLDARREPPQELARRWLALRDAQPHMQQLPVFAIAPGLMIFLTVISINFVGDGLRDALDPYGRR